jgi:hypothetical protein
MTNAHYLKAVTTTLFFGIALGVAIGMAICDIGKASDPCDHDYEQQTYDREHEIEDDFNKAEAMSGFRDELMRR